MRSITSRCSIDEPVIGDTHEIGGSALVIPGARDPGQLTFDGRADELGRAAAGRTKVARPCKAPPNGAMRDVC